MGFRLRKDDAVAVGDSFTVVDADNDAADADNDAADATSAGYSALDDTTKWATFDMRTVNQGAEGFSGAAFDGRYIYFVPNTMIANTPSTGGLVARYDTQAGFTAAASWSTFDITTVNAAATVFEGAAFDGRYVYFVPNGGGLNSQVTRYDTLASFTTSTSWATFDTTTLSVGAKGFSGAAFDGRYLYFAPNGVSTNDVVARYDTQASFAAGTSWTTFAPTSVNAGANGFWGTAFDGRYVYFVPWRQSIVTRYDTKADFNVATSWTTFDTTTLSARTKSYFGAGFDGRYLYFVPFYDTGNINPSGLFTRYDTQAAFTTGASWSTFDTLGANPNAQGFAGAAFDGRYIYGAPSFGEGTSDGVVARYDTQSTFTIGKSWATFDTTTLDPSADRFEGVAFDGRYVYFVPNNGIGGGAASGLVARFDAKTPSALPPGYAHGSFY